jgi:hypothetical protein
MPAQTMGTFTEPSVALIVPLLLMALLHTGKPMLCSSFTSRTPASMTSAARAAGHEGRGQQVAEVTVGAVGAVTAATTMSPSLICSAATCIIQLSPGCSSTVTAVPDTC